MTIVLPGLDQQLQPAIQGFGTLAQHLMNPDKKYVDALREAIAAGRISMQELNNMTPEEVSAKFNIKLQNAKQFTTGKPDSKTLTDRYTADELQKIYADPSDPRREELLAHVTGTQTGTQREAGKANTKIAGNEAQLSDMSLEQIQNDLKSTDPKVAEAARAVLAKRGTKDQLTTQSNQAKITSDEATSSAQKTEDMVKSRVSNTQLLSSIGGEKNLYTAYQQGHITPEQRQNIELDPELAKVFESQRDDYWKQRDLDFRNRSLGNKPEDIFLRKAAEMATKYGEYSGKSNPRDIYTVMQSPTLQAKYTDITDAGLDPAEKPMWEAAQAIKLAKDKIAKITTRQDMNDKLGVQRAFQTAAGTDIRMLSDPNNYRKAGVDEKTAQPIVDRINSQAASYYADLVANGIMDQKDVPQYAFDKNDPASERVFKNQAVLHQISGTGAIDKTDPFVEQAVAAIIKGESTIADLDKSSLSPEEKQAIKDKVAAAAKKGGK